MDRSIGDDVAIRRAGSSLVEVTTARGNVHGLVATGDSVEVLEHRLQDGVRFGFIPQEGWNAFEAMVVLSGALECLSHPLGLLSPGDTISAWPVREPYAFQARGVTVVLHVSSKPQFAAATEDIQRLTEMARQVARRDGYTHDHCLRVQTLASALGRAVGLAPDRLHWLLYGAYLHDVGKSRVPEELLRKPGPLTAEECKVMRQHARWGSEMLVGTRLEPASPIVLQHHERLDGSGYPDGLRDDAISLEARIVAICDTFDGIVTDRPYHRAQPVEVAVAELRRCAGRLLDASLIDMFVDLPLTSMVHPT